MTQPTAACLASETSVAVFDLSSRSQVKILGSDRIRFLQNFCTNDLVKLKPGEGCEAFCCNAKGRVVAHLTIFLTPSAIWVDAVPGAADGIINHLDRYVIREDVSFADLSGKLAQLAFVGPRVLEFLAPLLEAKFGPNFNAAALRSQSPISIVEFETDAATSLSLRSVDWLQQPVFLLVCPISHAEYWWTVARAAGVISGSESDWKSLRIASGFPEYGVDLSDAHLPQEAARNSRCLSFTKGCYLGQEPVARLDALGHTNRELRSLRLQVTLAPEPSAELRDSQSDEIAGHLTSVAAAPDGDGYVALAYIKTRWSKPDTELILDNGTARVLAPLN